MIDLSCIRKADPETAAAMERELSRQRENIELIASEIGRASCRERVFILV